MITPLADNKTWLARFAALPSWHLPAEAAIVVSPHPDDETLGTGGLIWSLRQRQVHVTVIAVTDGEGAYPDSPGLGETRQREQQAALARLGVPADGIVRLRLPDRRLAQHEDTIADALAAAAVRIGGPVHLYAPWQGDFHPDHEACGRAARRVADAAGLALTSYFFWTWHCGDLPTIEGLPLAAFRLSSEALAMKQEALECHYSQLHHASGEPILLEHLLGPARWPFEILLDEAKREKTNGLEAA